MRHEYVDNSLFQSLSEKPRSGEMFIEHEPELKSVKLRLGAQPNNLSPINGLAGSVVGTFSINIASLRDFPTYS